MLLPSPLSHTFAYPQNGQKDLGHPEPFLDRPSLSGFYAHAIAQQQLPQEGERAAQAPPSGGDRAQGTTDQERNMPTDTDTQDYGNSGVEGVGCGAVFRSWGRFCCTVGITGGFEGRQGAEVNGMCCRIRIACCGC